MRMMKWSGGVGQLLCLCALLGLLMLPASAAGNVCSVNGTEYATLSEGLSAAQTALSNGAVTVTLLSDASLDGDMTLGGANKLTLSAENKTVTLGADASICTSGAVSLLGLTLDGAGEARTDAAVLVSGALTMENVRVTGMSGTGVFVQKKGTLTAKNCSFGENGTAVCFGEETAGTVPYIPAGAVGVTFEEYSNMTGAEQGAFQKLFPDTNSFFAWLAYAMAEHEDNDIEVGDGGSVDLENLRKKGSSLDGCSFSGSAESDIRVNRGTVTLAGAMEAERISLASNRSVIPASDLTAASPIAIEAEAGSAVLSGDYVAEKCSLFTGAGEDEAVLADGTLAKNVYVASVGGVKYSQLADAFAAVKNATAAVSIELFGSEDFPAATTLTMNKYTQLHVTADAALTGRLTIDGEGASHSEWPFLVDAGVTFTMDGVTVQNITSTASNNGVFRVLSSSTAKGTLDFDGVTFKNCKAPRGVVYGQSGSVFSIKNSRFEGDAATTSGGAIFLYGSTANVENTVFVGNSAAQSGGAIHLATEYSCANLTNCTFLNNTAVQNGGAINAGVGNVKLDGAAMSGNKASLSASGIHVSGGTLSLAGAVELEPIRLLGGSTASVDGALTLKEGKILLDAQMGEIVLSGARMAEHSGKFTDLGGECMVNPRTGMLLTVNQNYIVDMAAAYYEKTVYTQYEMQKMAIMGNTGGAATGLNIRREPYATPGEISADEITYFDCSGFLFALYENSFGGAYESLGTSTANMMAKARAAASVGPESTVAYLYEKTAEGTLTSAEVTAISNAMREILLPGDVIVYRRTVNTGHTLVYMGNGYTLESGGSSYDYETGTDKVEADGTLALRVADDNLFKYSSSRCPMSKENFASIAILRPLNRATLNVSAMAKAQSANSGLSVTKRGLPAGRSVPAGGEITYTIELDNAPKIGTGIARTVTVTDILSDKVTLVSATDGGTVKNGVLTFADISLAAGEVRTLSYTVRVNADATGAVEGTICSANGVEAVCREVLIGDALTAAQEAALAQGLSTSKPSGMSALAWINSVYETAIGKSFLVSSNSELFDAIFAPSGSYYKISVDETQLDVATALVRTVTGGYHVTSQSFEEHRNRIRYVAESSLQFGDILATRDTKGNYAYYIYQGAGKELVKVTDSALTTADTEVTMVAMIANGRFALLRPSMMLDDGAVAKIGEVYYKTLEAALAAAKESSGYDEVVLLRNISWDSAATLHFDGYTRLVVQNGANIELRGPVTFDGGSVDGQCLPIRVTGAGSKLTLDGLTLQNFKNTHGGDDNNAYGAAIRVDSGASLSLTGVTVKNCVGTKRGALYVNTTGNVSIADSCFEGNGALSSYGGAIALYAVGKLSVTDTDFVRNTAADDGAAIRAVGAVEIDGCLFAENALTGTAYGVIRNDGAALTLRNTRLVGNTSAGTSTGIGIHHNTGTLVLENVTVTGNIRPGKTNYQDIAIRDTASIKGENTVDRLMLTSGDVLAVEGTVTGSIGLLGAAEGTQVLSGAAADVAASADAFTVLDANGAETELMVGADGVVCTLPPAAAEWSLSGGVLSVTLNKNAQKIVRQVGFARYASNGQMLSCAFAAPEAGECAFTRGTGEGKLFFLDANGVPVLGAQLTD